MECLINPWYVYLIGIVEPIREVAATFSFIGTVASCVFLFIYLCCDEDDREYKKTLRILKLSLFITIPNILMLILIPSKETLIQMYVASLTTPENLQTIKDLGESLTAFLKGNLLDIIKEVKK